MEAKPTVSLTLSMLRNPYGWHADEVKAARLHAADVIEALAAALEGAVELIETADWTAFSLADRVKLDQARAALAETKKGWSK